MVKSLIGLATIKKGIDITDEFTNTAARLNLINDGLQTQAELQDKIFAAADRSKGAYTDMATAISKMGILAGENFGSNDELIAFTELIQKSFKVGGASATEQSSALLQLTQAMSAGRLQGDEFRSIMENAPMIADAIAKFTGKSKGDLKEMSADGVITSDIIKNAMFMAADDINAKFETMPMTFADSWNKLKNAALQDFEGIIQLASKGAQFIGDNWSDVASILYGAAAGMTAFAIATTIADIANKGLKATILANPLLWVAVGIGVVVAGIAKWVRAVGGIDIAWKIAGNNILKGLDWLTIGYMTFVKAIDNFIEGMKVDFLTTTQELVNGGIDLINKLIGVVNEIPGIAFDTIDNVTFGATAQIEYKANKSARSNELARMKHAARMDAAIRQYEIDKAQQSVVDKATSVNADFDFSDFGTVSVVGTGKNGAVKIDMADEDLKYLRDIAERDYVNKFSTATLAPNVAFHISDIKETADVNKIKGVLERMMREEIAVAAEGAY
jgi:tape measure domain-containing protein